MTTERPIMTKEHSPAVRRYVLVTAAYNEESHIADTLRSVTSQTLPPLHWVIVSDGSTDRTDEIVRYWVGKYSFIEFVRVEKTEKHDFAAKVHALRRGFTCLSGVEYDFVGILDGDVSFEPDYFERLLDRFELDPNLGIAGGNIEQNVDGKDRSADERPQHGGGCGSILETRMLRANRWSASTEVRRRRRCYGDLRTDARLADEDVSRAQGGALRPRWCWCGRTLEGPLQMGAHELQPWLSPSV